MPSPRTTDPTTVGARWGAHARAPRVTALAAGLLILAALGAGLARPQLLTGSGGILPCPDAVLPLRLATFQGFGRGDLDVRPWLEKDEFLWSRALVIARRQEPTIHLVILTYVGRLAEALEVTITAPDGIVTYHEQAPIDSGLARMIDHTYYPVYVIVDFPPATWSRVFPSSGAYVVDARRPDTPPFHTDAFCGAELRSWVIVVR